ncbi:MAG: AmpG family muropeptide MFS transporter [Cycloclasticus pugetii]|uniref:AmpG family muropeptide MFS transporter n=1 Tax=Cycloclasticus pugetii TaxID=34068 RepID=UPI003A94DB2C
MPISIAQGSWLGSIRAFCQPPVIAMLFLGLSAGIPLLLIFSSLGLWLREAGIERATVTYFSWAALGYSFKFVWAPLVDKLPLPFLTTWLGYRRSWILFSQLMIIISICLMAFIDPHQDDLVLMAFAAILLGFSSATQDIVIDAYRIESAESSLQALMSSSYIAGYRIGMIVSGAGALLLANHLGSSIDSYSYSAWQWTYLCMASIMLIGVITTLLISEPRQKIHSNFFHDTREHVQLLTLFTLAVTGFIAVYFFSADTANQLKAELTSLFSNRPLASVLVEFFRLGLALAGASLVTRLLISSGLISYTLVTKTYIEPVKDFFSRYGYSVAWLLLALVGLYRISDIVLGVISNIFYQDLGFSKPEIASVVKTFGLLMTLLGGFIGGLLVLRFGVIRILFIGALLSALTNLLFMLLAQIGHNMPMLYLVISADNLSAGLASAAFIAFLSSLTNVSFTAVQYAIFSSLMTLLPKILGGYSGSMVELFGYEQFFLITALMGAPVLVLISWINKHIKLNV